MGRSGWWFGGDWLLSKSLARAPVCQHTAHPHIHTHIHTETVAILHSSETLPFENMFRSDLRGFNETRQVSLLSGVVVEADGSTQVMVGCTRVIVSLIGPTTSKYSRQELYDCAEIEVQVERSHKLDNDISHQITTSFCASFVKDCLKSCLDLEMFPKKLFLVKVLIAWDDGSVLSAVLNASMFAIVNAGLRIKVCITSLSFAVDPTTGLMLDPTKEEETNSVGLCTVVVSNSTIEKGKIIATDCKGLIELALLNDAIISALKTSAVVFESMKKAI